MNRVRVEPEPVANMRKNEMAVIYVRDGFDMRRITAWNSTATERSTKRVVHGGGGENTKVREVSDSGRFIGHGEYSYKKIN